MQIPNRTIRIVALTALALMVLTSFMPRYASADTVQSSDFQQQSFTKVVDWCDYVRTYAAANNVPAGSCSTGHVYIYANYVNVGGFQMLYTGLVNATNPDTGKFVTIPLQTFFEHYKTPGGKDAITASSFLSLISFTENSSTIYPNSPDRNDTIYASFSLGANLTAFAGHPQPAYVASSQVIPLTSPAPNQWAWGLRYTNLNAVWWRIGVDPVYPFWDPITPKGVAQYDELTFNYALTLNSTAKTAQLTTSYTIGKVTNLWVLSPLPVRHYNSTGTYDINGAQLPGPAGQVTVYDFLQSGGYKLSIVLANKTILASHTISDKTDSNASVDDSDANATRTAVTTSSDDGERIFKADFSAKPTYQLYDSSDANPQTYDVTVRSVRRGGWGGNPVFAVQNAFMGFLPLFVAHVDYPLFQAARAGLASFAASDYLYTISYPQWGGTRIVNDPSFTAFYQPAGNAGLLTAIFIAVAVAAGIGGVFAFLLRRKKTSSISFTGTSGSAPQGPAPPSPSGPSFPGR
jgi:multisubunit Na+/H+ antiporter MnhC subunit